MSPKLLRYILNAPNRWPKTLQHVPNVKYVSYIQGQEPEPKVREYFYFIDHQGMLFLDDSKMKNFTSCFKEKKFLAFFFKRVRLNSTGRYTKDFPYLSICGRERNFIRCDDCPIVYTHVIKVDQDGKQTSKLSYGYAGDQLTAVFEPERIFMHPETGRVYHPTAEITGGIGLVRSKLAIEFSKYFRFNKGESNPPTHFTWEDKEYELQTDWYYKTIEHLAKEIKNSNM